VRLGAFLIVERWGLCAMRRLLRADFIGVPVAAGVVVPSLGLHSISRRSGGHKVKEQGNSFYRTHILQSLAGATRVLLCAALAMLCTALAAKAQDTGYISGTVTDKSGSAVAGADVVISSTNGSATHTTTTNGDGAYVVSGLAGGTYDLVVSAKGFQKYTAQGVVLDVARKIRVDVVLTVGAITEEVVVTGESVAQVETQSSALGSTINATQVSELVLNGRNFTHL